MKRFAERLIACALSACMTLAALPAAAGAAEADGLPSVGNARNFVQKGDTAEGQTILNVRYDASLAAEFCVADQTRSADIGTLGEDGLLVGLANGKKPYAVSWYRMYAGSVDGELADAPEPFDPAATGVEALGSQKGTADQSIFNWDPRSDSLQAGATYYYWAVATDAAMPAATAVSEPITFANETGYRSEAIYDDVIGADWTWSMGGFFTYADVDLGRTGAAIRKGATLSAPSLSASSSAYQQLEAAAGTASGGMAAKVEGAWHVAASNLLDYPDVFAGDVLVRLDVTDVVEALAGSGADDAAREAVLAGLRLLWMDPYETGVTPAQVSTSQVNLGTGEPYGFGWVRDDVADAYYLTFYMPSKLAGESGVLGAFALTSPVPVAEMVQLSASATTGGQIAPSGTRMAARGTQPEFMLYPQVAAGYQVKDVEVSYADASGATRTAVVAPTFEGEAPSSAAGTLVGNVFTMAPLGSTADDADAVAYRVVARFEQVSPPVDPDDPTKPASFTASFAVETTGSTSSDTCVTFWNGPDQVARLAGGESSNKVRVSAGEPIVVRFDAVATGYAPDRVRVTYTSGDNAGRTAPYVVPDDADSLSLPPLSANASIQVTFKEALPPLVVAEHTLEAVVAAGQQDRGTASVNPAVVAHNGTALFTAAPAEGFQVESAKVLFRDSADSAWREGAVYAADRLVGGTSLTLTNILSDTRVEFSFAGQTLHVTVPDRVDHGQVSVSGATSSNQGAYEVAYGDTLTVTVTPDEGYQLAEGGLLLVPGDGSAPINVSFARNADGTCVAELPFALLATAGDGATLSFHIEKTPLVIDPDDPEGPSLPIEVGPDDEGRPIVIRPSDPSTVVDTVVVDGIEILDKDGVELKDKLTERDENGLWWHPDYPGIKYDPTTDEYILLPSGDRFTFDPITGTIIFTQVGEGNSHEVDATMVAGKRVRVQARFADGDEAGGSLIPQGLLTWKADQEFVAVAVPDTGYEVASVFVGNEKVDTEQASVGHVQAARETQRKAQIWTGTTDLIGNEDALAAQADEDQTSLLSRVRAHNSVVTALAAMGSIARTVDVTVVEGTRTFIIPAEYFASRATTPVIEVVANFQKIGASAGSETATHTVKASVRGSGGTIDGAAEQTVDAGASCTVAFKPHVGYQVAAVYVDGGARTAWSARTYTFSDVQADHTIEVEFSAVGYSGDNGAAARAVRTLQTLAATGDLNAPALTLLVGVAFAAAGIAVLGRNRRRGEGGKVGESG